MKRPAMAGTRGPSWEGNAVNDQFFNIGSMSGSNIQVGGTGNAISQGSYEPPASGLEGTRGRRGSAPEHLLYAFADIVGYSKLPVSLQRLAQEYLASVLAGGVTQAGVSPELVDWQDQGDARMMTFPAGTDAGSVLAEMPRYVHDELLDHNQYMELPARMRLRMAFTMGVSEPGATGRVGAAPIAVARLVNWGKFRRLISETADAYVGVIMDDHLYGQYVRQSFRSGIDPNDYAPAHISNADKGFEADAWVRIFRFTGEKVAALLDSA